MNTNLRIILTLAIGAAIFLTAIFLPGELFESQIARRIATQGLELILALAAIAIIGKGKFAAYGFCKPRYEQTSPISLLHWSLFGLGAMAMGGVATTVMLLSGAAGNPIARQMTFPEVVIFVWILSSTIEEVLTRGFIQSDLATAIDPQKRIPFLRVNYPTLISAIFFGLMHLSLWLKGADFKTLLITILFTFSLGLLAGYLRDRTKSLFPAIGAHMLANIGGAIGGIIYAIITILSGGEFPIH